MGTTQVVLTPQGSLVGHLTPAINNPRDPQSLGRDSAEAFTLLDGGMQDIITAINQVANQPAKLPIVIRDPLGNVVGILGYATLNNTAIYGLTTYDQRGNVGSFVGVQTEVPLAITATTDASPDVVTVPTHGYVNGDTVLIFGSLGDTAINGIGIVENVTANTFTLTTLGGTPINGNGAYSGGGFSQRYYAGGKFQTVIIGGNNQIRAFADGSVLINGATLTLNLNGVTTTIGNIPVGAGGNAGVDVKNNTAPSRDILMTDHGFYIRAAADQSTFIAQLTGLGGTGDNGQLILNQQSNVNKKIIVNSAGLGGPQVSVSDGTNSSVLLAGTLNLNTGAVVVDGTTSQITAGSVFIDGVTPEITFGNPIQLDIKLNVITYSNVAGTTFVHFSTSGTINGRGIGGTTFQISPGSGVSGADAVGPWSLSGSAGVSGTDAVGAWALNGTNLTFGGTQVVAHRKTGWHLPTGTLSRATFDQSTVTLPQLAQVVAALVTDLFNQHGLIGT
jgi:hypothetical protein